MSLDARIYRVGSNYKLNLSPMNEDYVDQYRDELHGYDPLYDARFYRYEELDSKVKELCNGNDRDFEFDLTKEVVEDLMVFAMKSENEQANTLMLACRDAFRALREGYKIVYESDR